MIFQIIVTESYQIRRLGGQMRSPLQHGCWGSLGKAFWTRSWQISLPVWLGTDECITIIKPRKLVCVNALEDVPPKTREHTLDWGNPAADSGGDVLPKSEGICMARSNYSRITRQSSLDEVGQNQEANKLEFYRTYKSADALELEESNASWCSTNPFFDRE